MPHFVSLQLQHFPKKILKQKYRPSLNIFDTIILNIDKKDNNTPEVTNKRLLEQEFDKAPFLARHEEDSSKVHEFYCGDTSELQKELEKVEKESNQNMDADSSDSDEESLRSEINGENIPSDSLSSESDDGYIPSDAKIYKQMIDWQRAGDINSNLNNP